MGLDAGTLPTTTAYVTAGIARVIGSVELRGAVRYGLPREEEEESTQRSERLRRAFAAVELGACYGWGARWRLSTCAGSELGAVRETRHLRSEQDLDVDTDVVQPRLAGVIAALVAYRGGVIQPELELSSAAVALGRQDRAAWLAVRAAMGAAVQF